MDVLSASVAVRIQKGEQIDNPSAIFRWWRLAGDGKVVVDVALRVRDGDGGDRDGGDGDGEDGHEWAHGKVEEMSAMVEEADEWR